MGSARFWRAIQAGSGSIVHDALWYAAFAGALWLLFHVVFHRAMAHRKVIQRIAPWRQLGVEVGRSLRSIFVFGVVTVLVVWLGISGHTRMYLGAARHGWPWFFASVAIAVVVHDAYFYWTHRLMHWRPIFRVVHRTHHLSTNPTPWAAYSFSTVEAFIQAGIGPLLVFTIPMHPLAFLAFMTWQIAFNVFGHCGYEIFPAWFLRTWPGMLLNTPTHHALHHDKVRGNYGLYFNIWDRLMGTNHADYEMRFARATTVSRPNMMADPTVMVATIPVSQDETREVREAQPA